MTINQSKRALITGGNRGIGFAIAQGLLAQGYEVIMTARSFDRATQAAEQLSGSVMPIELDVSPGWVRTDMGGTSATRSPEQGADTAIWLATSAPRSHSGKFFRDRRSIDF